LRGEAQKVDYKRAKMWFERGAEVVSFFLFLRFASDDERARSRKREERNGKLTRFALGVGRESQRATTDLESSTEMDWECPRML